VKPPRLARALLRLLLSRELVDAVEGDLLEGFERMRGEGRGARVWFWKEVLTFPYASLRRRERRVRRKLVPCIRNK
jgi:hypothetical protein